jgi:DNA-binding MarR family transcriptional regulator
MRSFTAKPGLESDGAGLLYDLARFRYNLRKFLRFSEEAARAEGITPQQHQLMLGVAGFGQDGRASISQLAEFLQERNNSVVGLVERAAQSGLVRRQNAAADRRQVLVSLTARGRAILLRLSRLHVEEVRTVQTGFLSRHSFARPSQPGKASASNPMATTTRPARRPA